MSIYPISLTNLKEYIAVIVGGGRVAARKLAGLWNTDFHIKIISPSLCEDILVLIQKKREFPVQIISRPYQVGDLDNAFLVIAATNDSTINDLVWKEAIQEKCLINIASDPEKSNFYNPSILQYGSLTVAFSSNDGCPALLSWLRKQCETIIDDDFIQLLRLPN
jgi:precorrin-2 dehydrogenase/sirohydrochlorin ferrochelatase